MTFVRTLVNVATAIQVINPLSGGGAFVTATLAASPTWSTLAASAVFDRAPPVHRT